MLLRKLRYGNLKALYAIQGMFSISNLNAQITSYYCHSMVFHQSANNALEVVPGNIYPCQSFSTIVSTILVQARDPAKLSEELQNALDEHKLNEAWNLHEQHMNMEGFPRKSVVNKLLTTSSQSLQLHLPVHAATVLRKLVETQQFPPVTAWSAILAHMSLTPSGAYLAAELVLEIGFLFQDGRVDPRKKINEELIAMKPNTTAVNIALGGCLLFGTNRKAEQLLDMIPRIGVKTDVTMLIMMGHVYEQNGRKEELKKLKRYIDEAHDLRRQRKLKILLVLLLLDLKP
ncbi:unnamed protein product [Lactuca virosa]|uniref:Pentatricopeptide repeat-containing protein n=1 Tax=Lactuca virosa TaxID=75947 RepID=A0AAU9PIP3_9ASTR|nr:unnamed protein product [Lactuca virosa]